MPRARNRQTPAATAGCLLAVIIPMCSISGFFICRALYRQYLATPPRSPGAEEFAIPGIFLFIGLIFLLSLVKHLKDSRRRTDTAAARTGYMTNPAFPVLKSRPSVRGTVNLSPAQHRVTAAIVLGIVALIWNGAIGGIAFGVLREGVNFPAVAMVAFLSLFAVVGIILLIAALHQVALVLTVGRTWVELTREPLPPDARSRFSVYQDGNFAVTEATARLVGREKIRWVERRGKRSSTHTKSSEFLSTEVARGGNLRAGTASPLLEGELAIPPGAMHSFHTHSCMVEWGIEVEVKIPGRPDVKEFFPFRVSPERNT